MGDFLWNLFLTAWKSDTVRMVGAALTVVFMGYIARVVFAMKDDFDKHVANEEGQFALIKQDITTIKDNHLKHLADDVKKLDGKVDKLMFHLLGSSGSESSEES